MKKYLSILLIPIVTACQAEQAAAPYPKFEETFSKLSSDQVFKTSFPALLEQLKGSCNAMKKAANDFTFGNVECTPETGIKKLQLAPTGDPTISQVRIVFAAGDKCEAAKKVLTKRYGKAHGDKGGCFGEWKLKSAKGGAVRKASLEPGDTNEGIFDLDEEQGP
jgi:hypothetical protein